MIDDKWDKAVQELDLLCPPPDSKWRHRNGDVYRVVQGCIIEATCTAAVLYTAAGNPCTLGELQSSSWVRPLAEFLDGRFTLVSDGN